MLSVDHSLFANVISAVQRTGSLTGGSVGGLPNGVVIEGLKGINSFASDIADAQKEFERGRIRSALDRVKQIELQFNGITGRWNSTVGSVLSSARQGRQQLSIQKLNEVKNAQTRMQQLTGPATKAFRDLVSALEHAVSQSGRNSEEDQEEEATSGHDSEKMTSASGQTDDPVSPPQSAEVQKPQSSPSSAPVTERSEERTPDPDVLGTFAENYQFGPKLKFYKGPDNKTRVEPRLQAEKFYFVSGLDPPSVVRVREIRPQSLLVFDAYLSRESELDNLKLRLLMRRGIWLLDPRDP